MTNETNVRTDEGNQGDSGYGPIRTTPLTHAMRRNLNDLDFEAPIRKSPAAHDTMEVQHQKGMQWHVFVSEEGSEEHSLMSMEQVEKSRKVKHRELNPRNLSVEKRKELDNAKVKEWNKIFNSGAVKVYSM